MTICLEHSLNINMMTMMVMMTMVMMMIMMMMMVMVVRMLVMMLTKGCLALYVWSAPQLPPCRYSMVSPLEELTYASR